MSETVERNNRFYKQPDGKVLTENEQLKEWLVIANKHNEELQKERDMYKCSFETMSENYFKLENIIKEVRKEVRILESNCDISDYHAQKLYQTLDKENKQ